VSTTGVATEPASDRISTVMGIRFPALSSADQDVRRGEVACAHGRKCEVTDSLCCQVLPELSPPNDR